MKRDVSALILAGGESRRFGGDKAHHLLSGRRLIEYVLEGVYPLCDDVLVSLSAESPEIELDGVRFVRDRYPKSGPLAGIHAGLMEVESTWMLVVACDMPFLQTADLDKLLDRRDAACRAVVASDPAGRLHPTCACYRHDLLPLVEAQLREGRNALHALLDQVDDLCTVVLPDSALRNVNTRGDADEEHFGVTR